MRNKQEVGHWSSLLSLVFLASIWMKPQRYVYSIMLGDVADILDKIIYMQNMLEHWDGAK